MNYTLGEICNAFAELLQVRIFGPTCVLTSQKNAFKIMPLMVEIGEISLSYDFKLIFSQLLQETIEQIIHTENRSKKNIFLFNPNGSKCSIINPVSSYELSLVLEKMPVIPNFEYLAEYWFFEMTFITVSVIDNCGTMLDLEVKYSENIEQILRGV